MERIDGWESADLNTRHSTALRRFRSLSRLADARRDAIHEPTRNRL